MKCQACMYIYVCASISLHPDGIRVTLVSGYSRYNGFNGTSREEMENVIGEFKGSS